MNNTECHHHETDCWLCYHLLDLQENTWKRNFVKISITERHLHETECWFHYDLLHCQENVRQCNVVEIWNTINTFVDMR